jgi:hypothetical protein
VPRRQASLTGFSSTATRTIRELEARTEQHPVPAAKYRIAGEARKGVGQDALRRLADRDRNSSGGGLDPLKFPR